LAAAAGADRGVGDRGAADRDDEGIGISSVGPMPDMMTTEPP
jgi:hypothetical protein